MLAWELVFADPVHQYLLGQASSLTFRERLLSVGVVVLTVTTALLITRMFFSRSVQADRVFRHQGESINQLHESIVTVDTDDYITSWNKEAERQFGYTAEEAIGLRWDICFKRRREAIEREIISPLLKNGRLDVEENMTRKSRENFDGHVLGSVITDPDGTITGMAFCVLDVTERKRAEEALREQATIIDQVHESVVLADMDGFITGWNRGAEQLFGYSKDDALGKHFSVLYEKQEVGKHRSDLKESVLKSGRHGIETRLKRQSGELFDGHVLLSLMCDPNGDPIGIVGYTIDITERKRAEEALRKAYDDLERLVVERTRELQTTLETLIEGVITIDERGVIESFNPSAETLFGYRADEVVGQNVSILMSDQVRMEHDSYLQRYLETGEAKVIGIGREVTGRQKNGTLFPLKLGIGEMQIGDRRKFVGTVHDITERRRSEEILRKNEGMFRALTENTTDQTLVIGMDGIITYASPAVERTSGYTVGEVVGQKYESFALQ